MNGFALGLGLKRRLRATRNGLLFGFTLLPLVIGYKISRHFVNQLEVKPKPIMTCSHAFSRAWRRLHVFAVTCDWLIVLSVSVVIGQSNDFGFCFTTLN